MTVHCLSSKVRKPLATKGSASAIARASWALAARRIISTAPVGGPSPSAKGPDANRGPRFSVRWMT